MPKFLVVSLFEEEGQILIDVIEAEDSDKAMELVGEVREYAEVCEAWTEEDLDSMREALRKPAPSTKFGLASELDEGKEFCRTCDANLEEDAGEGYDGECGACADKTAKKAKRRKRS